MPAHDNKRSATNLAPMERVISIAGGALLIRKGLAIGGLLFNDRIVSALVHILVGEPTLPWSYWWAPLLGMGLWPLVFVLLDAVRFGKRGR